MMTPKISVIVPVYNVELFIDTCIRSIIAQNYDNFELLLIDDGSTDNSGQICDRFAVQDARIRVIHQQNGGLSSARNTGLMAAKGEYIAFVDSDDYIPATAFSDLLSVLAETGADMVKGNFQKVFEDGASPKQYDEAVTILTAEKAIENFLCELPAENKKVSTVVWNALYRRELFDTVSFPVGLIYEDGYVTPQLILKANMVAHINKVVYFYRQNPNGIMSSGLTELALKSIDDQKENHYLIIGKFPQFANITSKRWADKYLDVMSALKKDRGLISPAIKKKYNRYIRIELIRNMLYFHRCGGMPLRRMMGIFCKCLFNF